MVTIDNLNQVANQIETERGVNKEVLYSAIEQALAAACKKKMRSEALIECELNPETGNVDFFDVKNVVEIIEDELIEITVKEAKKIKKSY